MSTSVATESPERVEIDPAVLAVQEQRLPQLLAVVRDGALCASTAPGMPSPDDWHRNDDDEALGWRRRRVGLQAVCAACPVRAACEESALREGEGSNRRDADMVRGGLTGPELFAARTAQAGRLAAAVEADRVAAKEDRELRRLTTELRRLVCGASRHGVVTEKANNEVRHVSRQIREVVAARRARSGWGTAA